MPALFCLFAAFVIIATGVVVSNSQAESARTLQPVSAFADVADRTERSVALFVEAGKVLQHPRCVNCHPAGDRPMQGNDGHPHQPLVMRGADGFGAIGMRCPTCHGKANFEPGGVPGNPVWHLAPIEMAWQGKSLGEICAQVKDRERNGDKSMEDLIHHMGEDPLVGWAWKPGADREPAPGTQEEFGELIKAWVETGGACPSS
jgi:hypothetical protein